MSEYTKNVWVGIEITRQMRVKDGSVSPASELQIADVNLLEHQVKIAKKLTSPDQVCILTPQADERMLELMAEHEVRELAPFDFIAMLADRVKQSEEGAVVLLRQIAPLQDEREVAKALKKLKKHPVIYSASKPPKGWWHGRHPEPETAHEDTEYRCLAFEIRRMSEFGPEAMSGFTVGEPQMIPWGSFAEYITREDMPNVRNMIQSWQR